MKFQRETVRATWDEALPLLQAHQAEVGIGSRFLADRAAYERLDDVGDLLLYTARFEGKLVGYAVFIVAAHRQLPNKVMSFQDALFVSPEHRGVGAVEFMHWTDKALKEAGVDYVVRYARTSSDSTDYGRTLLRMGYEAHSVEYLKEI